jgi:aminotransferase
VIVTVGSEEGMFLSVAAAIDPGEEVLVPERSYPAYRGMVVLAGGAPVSYQIERESGLVPRAEKIAEKLTPRTRAIVLNSPSNPFGTITPPEELEQIGRLCEEHGLVAISDDVYAELVYSGGRAPSIAEHTARSILVGGLSKSCAFCGYRLGYVVADGGFTKQATVAHQMMVTCAPRLAQLMAIEVFQRPELLRAHLPFYAKARERLELVGKELPADAPMFLGDGAFYAVIDVSRYAREGSMALALELLDREDVVVVPGIAFGANGDWFWRLSYAAGAEIAGEGMARIARFIRGASSRPAAARP